jgi:hypothetical protein
MIEVYFEGWFQCRLATNPDDYREPRGDSGWTFAFGDEPDLDRVIRFHEPVAVRSHGPKIGVFVTLVEVNGAAFPNGLVGAPVTLKDDAKFEGRDGEIANDAQEPIVPFHVRIGTDPLTLESFDPIDLNSQTEIHRRKPIAFSGNSPEVLAVTGIGDPSTYRSHRVAVLNTELQNSTDAAQRAALEVRIAEAKLGSIRRNSLAFKLTYEFELRGPNQVSSALTTQWGSAIARARQWRTRFWMGGWDADALSGFVKGSLVIE